MRNFIDNWKENFRGSWLLALVVIIVLNFLDIVLESGLIELQSFTDKFGLTVTILLFVFSIVANAILLALLTSLVLAVIDLFRRD